MDRAFAAGFVDRRRQPEVSVTNIPTGPSNVVQRLLAFTGSGGANFYNVPATMTINDNTTTSLTVDFTDTILLSGTSMDYLFSQIELPEQLGVVDYSERLFWWGERANMDNWRNLTFDGGWDASGSGRPLGWQLDPSFGAGGEPRVERRGVGRRLPHHGRRRHRRARHDLRRTHRGRGGQSAVREQHGLFRARAREAQLGPHRGHAAHQRLQPHGAGSSAPGLAVSVTQADHRHTRNSPRTFSRRRRRCRPI